MIPLNRRALCAVYSDYRTMDAQQDLIGQLEEALSNRNLSKRAEILRHVTDLFLVGAGSFTDDQVSLFGDLMARIVERIEVTARAAFASRLAGVANAPSKIIRMLATDDAVEVAAPVLRDSLRLDDVMLVENARTMGQGHLLAISRRSGLAESVTDVLVSRGDHVVLVSTASNAGARFSEFGTSTLVGRAQGHEDLASCIWSRSDIPRDQLVRLFAQASDIVRLRLTQADPSRAELIRGAVADASDEIQATARAGSDDHTAGLTHVTALHSHGRLDETRLLGFARSGSFDRTSVALSLMCDLPIGPIERALSQDEPEQLMVLAKAIDLSWETTKAMLTLPTRPGGVTKEWLDRYFASFLRLRPKTARAALQFYRLRAQADRHPPQ